MTEKLKLVTSFSQLKAGDLVVVKPCGHCGGTHRGMLTGPRISKGGRVPGGTFDGPVPVFDISPDAGCPSNTRTVIGRIRIARREVFIVDTGLEQSQSTERRKELAR